MISDIALKKILICGLNGTGKTHLAKYLSRYLNCLVITMNPQEWIAENVIIGECKTPDDYKLWINNWRNFKDKINAIILDDFDIAFNTHFDSMPNFADLCFRNRHLGLTIIGITRRPQNIPTKYYETFEILALFYTESVNALDKFNNIYKGLGDMVKTLTYTSYNFIWKELGNSPVVLKV